MMIRRNYPNKTIYDIVLFVYIATNFQSKTYLSLHVHISLLYISILIDDTIPYMYEYVCNLDNTKFKYVF